MDIKISFDEFKIDMKKSFDELKIDLATRKDMRDGFERLARELGYGLNKRSTDCLKSRLASKGYVDAKVIRNFKIEDPNTKDQRVVAAFCLSPLYILESTSFLCTDEFEILERIVETRRNVERESGLKCEELIFYCDGFDGAIEEKSMKFMKDNNIHYMND